MSKTIVEIFDMRAVKPFVPAKEKPVECSFPSLLVGLELETENIQIIETGDRPAQLAKLLNATGITMSSDNSLRGRSAEFITKPTRMDYMIPNLTTFFKGTEFTENNYSERCSIHVHMNVQDFTLEQLANLCLLYSVTEDILFEFIAQNLPEGIPRRDQNIFCVPWSQCRWNGALMDKILNQESIPLRNWQKYTALNLVPVHSQGTVEFRQLFGTSDMKIISQWLNLIGCLASYAVKSPFDALHEEIKILNTSSHYERFFNEVFGGYLTYTPEYQQHLYNGVLNAKLSLIDFKRKDGTKGKESLKMVLDDLLEATPVVQARPVPTPNRRVAPTMEEIQAQRLEFERALNQTRAQIAAAMAQRAIDREGV